MTYRERRLRKAEKLREWADKRRAKAAAIFKADEQFTTDIAFNTQPGHFPFRARLIARHDREYQSLNKADAMESRADNIDAAADRAIYSDDPDVIEALQLRIAELEAKRARMKYINKEIHKGAGYTERITPPMTPEEMENISNRYQPFYGIGYPPYAFQNLSGNINRQKKRLAGLQREDQERGAA